MTALTDVLTKHRFRAQDHGTIAYRSHCYCGWWEHTNGKREVDVHASHVEAELLAAGIVAIQLPEPTVRGDEKEWEFASQAEDGWVNLDKGDITFDLAKDSGEWGGLPTVAEGLVPSGLAVQFAAAILAASVADRPTPTPGDPTP